MTKTIIAIGGGGFSDVKNTEQIKTESHKQNVDVSELDFAIDLLKPAGELL